ncbi:MAG TPA: WXG100 family type VII secretion target [Rugosimonospora sp.]|nr:WXG100 family type VII secretion target [Rugosimonospora sp.]
MSGDRVQYTYAAGYAAADAVNSTARRLVQQIDELLQALGPIKADWYQSGSTAAAAAQQLETKLRTAMDDMVQLIGAFGNAITTNTQTAQQTDNAIASNLFA